MKKIITVWLLVACIAMLILPTAAEPATPFDASVAEIERAVAAGVGTDTAGAAVVLVKNGTVVMADGFGYADLATRVLVTSDATFELGGFSSLFAATAVLHLAETGALSLDADIAAYLPADFMAELGLSHPVTTRQLLTGRAGFGGRIFDISFTNDSYCFESLAEALLADVPEQVTVPGTVYAYSEFGIALAAYIVEVVSGVSYEAYVEREILIPLGMTDTVLSFTADTVLKKPAVGYLAAGEGVFETPADGYRTYAGLYPATGAASTAADLARFLTWLTVDNGVLLQPATKAQLFETFANGIFTPAAMVLEAKGTVYTCKASTNCFGVSLALNRLSGQAVLVLTNTPENTLLSLPETMLVGQVPALSLPAGEPVELKPLCGTYLSVTAETHTFVGRMLAMQQRVAVTENDDGTLSFRGMRLTQIARGVFADVNGDAAVPAVQFLFDEEGEVSAVLTADGACYTPLPLYYARVPSALLFGALLLLAVRFLLAGALALARYVGDRNKEGEYAHVRFLLPELLAALLSVLVAVQLLVAYNAGAAVLSSFYLAMQIIVLLVGIGATVAYLFAFVSSVLNRKVHKRIAYAAILYLVFLFLICFWGFTVI